MNLEIYLYEKDVDLGILISGALLRDILIIWRSCWINRD